MVKVLGHEIRIPFLQEKMQALEADTAQSWFHRSETPVYKPEDINDYYESYLNHDLIRGMVDDLAESAAGQGFYTTVQNVEYNDQNEPLENKAKKLCDHFGQFHNLDSLLPNITKNMLIAGFCPVETRLGSGTVEKTALKIIHPKTIKTIRAENGIVELIIQKVGSKEAEISGNSLAWFVYGQIGNDVRGCSFVRSILGLLNTLESVTADVEAILDRYVAPKAVWKSRRSLEAIKKAVKESDPGEDIFLGELTPEEISQKIVEFVQVDPRVPFWDFIENLQQRIYSYSRSSNLWYTRNATEASANVMEDIVRRHVNAIQRSVKRAVERFWFAPLIKAHNLSEVPKLNFGAEPTGVEDIRLDRFLEIGVETGYITPKQYFDVLNQLGVKIKTEQETGSSTPPSQEPES